jgi:hypothetical protein
MADLWFRKFGFGTNPFTIKPAAFSFELFGVDTNGVISGIEEGKIIFVEAPLGFGKTTLLKSIIYRFGGKKKVVYAHALPSEKLDVKDLLKRSSVASFITGNLPSNMILLVDEAQHLMSESSAEILEFYKNGNIKAVIFFGTNYSKGLFVSEFEEALNGNVVKLSHPTPEQAISLVRSRIGNLPLISDDEILVSFRKADGSPRKLLQICEDICRAAAEGRPLEEIQIEAEEVPVEVLEKKQKPKRKGVKHSKTPKYQPPSLENVPPKSETFEQTVILEKQKSAKKKARKHVVAAKVEIVKAPVKVGPVKLVAPEQIAALVKPATPAVKVGKPVKKKHSEAKPTAKVASKSTKAIIHKKGSASKQVPEKKPKESEATENTEGRYWGEFMGMQKED